MAKTPKNISNKTANRIRQLRISKGLTQQELAEKLFKSDSTIRMWELGKSEPDIETLGNLCAIFDVSMDYLLGNAQIQKPANEDELPMNTIVMNRNGEITRKTFTAEQMKTIAQMIDGVPEKDKDI